MERDERAALVGRRKLMSGIKQQVVWRPMTWKRRDRSALVGTQTNRFPAVTAVFWSKHKLTLAQIKVAIRPAVVGTALDPHQLLRRLIGTLLRRIEVRPVLPQLVAAMLGRKHPAHGIERDPLPVAQPGDEALGRREPLPRSIGVVAPDAGPRLELGAWLNAWRTLNSICDLAGICRGAEVDIQPAFGIDSQWVHRMIAGNRQAGYDHLGGPARRNRACRQGVANDAIICLCVERAIIECDSG